MQSNGHIPMSADLYQDRLARLESDKESLVLQVTQECHIILTLFQAVVGSVRCHDITILGLCVDR